MTVEKSELHGGVGAVACEPSALLLEDSTTHVKAVRLWCTDALQAVETTYTNGHSVSMGKKCGPVLTLQLETEERILSVSGRSSPFGVLSLRVVTSRRELRSNNYDAHDFEFHVPRDREFIGFHGHFGSRVNSIGIVQRPATPPQAFVVQPIGTVGTSGNGGEFHPLPEFITSRDVVLQSVRLWEDHDAGTVSHVEFTYNKPFTYPTATTATPSKELHLHRGEFVVGVTGCHTASGNQSLNYVSVETNAGRVIAAGKCEGESSVVRASIGMELIAVTAAKGTTHLQTLSFAQRPSTSSSHVLRSATFGTQHNATDDVYHCNFSSDINSAFAQVRRVQVCSDQGLCGVKFELANAASIELGDLQADDSRHVKELQLNPGEYIERVEGSTGYLTTKLLLTYLCFTTNKGRKVYGGARRGHPFVVETKHSWEIVALSGTFSDRHITKVCFAQKPHVDLGTLAGGSGGQGNTDTDTDGGNLKVGPSYGGTAGGPFTKPTFVSDASVRVIQVRVWGMGDVEGVEFSYSNGQVALHGRGGGMFVEQLQLQEGEYLTGGSGSSAQYVNTLAFTTNLGHTLQTAGWNGGFSFSAPAGGDWEIVALEGASGWLLDRVAAVWRKRN